jgi:UDP-N-acetylmuramoyl-tripeptide--D-alanyl-D-alanine ligase
VAVTGSNGKTTVKEMIAAILRGRGRGRSSGHGGNLNNDIGLPLTVLRLRAHTAGGARAGHEPPGRDAYLAGIAQPTVAVVNNAQREHQEFMVSVEAVAHEHASAIAALPADGVAVFPVDAESGGAMRPSGAGRRHAARAGVRDRCFGRRTGHGVAGEWRAGAGCDRARRRFTLRLQVLGAQRAQRAGGHGLRAGRRRRCGGDPGGLAGFTAVKGRLQVKHTRRAPS